MKSLPVFVGLVLLLASPLPGSDWPGFLGMKQNGSSGEKIGTPRKDPKILWKIEANEGFSSPVIVQNHAYLFQREGNQESLAKVKLLTGKVIWKKSFPTSYQDDFGKGNGPRSTPSCNAGRIFTLSPTGVLRALETETGNSLWELDILTKYEGAKGFFGVGTSPLAVDQKVFVMAGGKKAGVICLDAKTGQELWASTPFPASYSSPVAWGNSLAIIHRQGLAILDQNSGKTQFFTPFRSRYDASVNASNPIFWGDHVFLTSSYGTGGLLLKKDGDQLQKVWANDQSLSCHFSTPIFKDGILYGYHGRQEAGTQLRAIEALTGKVLWETEEQGSGNLLSTQNHLITLSENGVVRAFDYSREKTKPVFEVKVFNGLCRTPLAISQGILLGRDSQEWICFQAWD